MERGAGGGASEGDAHMERCASEGDAAHRRVKVEPGLEEEPAAEHFGMVQTYVPAGVCSPDAACAVKQEMDVGPKVLQPTELQYMTMQPKLEWIKEEPIEMEQDSTYVPAGVCSPDAVCAVKQEMEVGPTVLQQTELQYMTMPPKLEWIKEEPIEVEFESSVSMSDETALTSNNVMKRHHVFVSKLQGKKKKRSDVYSEILPKTCKELSMTQSGYRNFKCEVCLKSYAYKSLLNIHMVMHTDVRAFKCDICLKSYKYKCQLKSHQSVVHTGVRAFKCDLCPKSYKYKCELKSHMAVHAGVRAFKCDVCLKSFTHKRYLKSHMALHTGVRIYICDVCQKSCTQKHHLKSHMALHTGTVIKKILPDRDESRA